MNALLTSLSSHLKLSGDLEQDMVHFLSGNGYPKTAEHSVRVGREARKLAERFGVDPDLAAAAGYMHDISAVFPNSERIMAAEQLGVEILPEERIFPMIIHQKLSKPMARELFGITNENILNAVECHTTLKTSSSTMDRVLFVADKIEWDQAGVPPYLDQLLTQLERSLEHAAFAYLSYLWENKEHLKVLHPWTESAYLELKQLCEN